MTEQDRQRIKEIEGNAKECFCGCTCKVEDIGFLLSKIKELEEPVDVKKTMRQWGVDTNETR